jgi:hypothetical protein
VKGGLRLDSRAALLKGGDNGSALLPGRPDQSRLIEAISYKNADLAMPPKGKLPDAIQADLAAWVKMGAPWPNDRTDTGPRTIGGVDIARRKQEHWCWQPLHAPRVPAVHDAAWPRDPVDRFILAKLEREGLRAADPADRRTWLRRVTFDLIGLPPTPTDGDTFLADKSPEACEKVVDRLLESPQFGERWARHWLDLVRYGETRGHEFDPNIPNAYQWPRTWRSCAAGRGRKSARLWRPRRSRWSIAWPTTCSPCARLSWRNRSQIARASRPLTSSMPDFFTNGCRQR